MTDPVVQPLPVVERIAQAIQAAMAAITLAAGYRITVSGCHRPIYSGDEVSEKDLRITLQQGDEKVSKIYPGLPARIEWNQAFLLDLGHRVGESHGVKHPIPVDQTLNVFLAEVKRCAILNRRWGGLAIDTHFGGTVFWLGTGGEEGCSLTITVDYRTLEGDPYTQA